MKYKMMLGSDQSGNVVIELYKKSSIFGDWDFINQINLCSKNFLAERTDRKICKALSKALKATMRFINIDKNLDKASKKI